ncbi:hypothetical protein D3C86_1483630 [compost metagenome]
MPFSFTSMNSGGVSPHKRPWLASRFSCLRAPASLLSNMPLGFSSCLSISIMSCCTVSIPALKTCSDKKSAYLSTINPGRKSASLNISLQVFVSSFNKCEREAMALLIFCAYQSLSIVAVSSHSNRRKATLDRSL